MVWSFLTSATLSAVMFFICAYSHIAFLSVSECDMFFPTWGFSLKYTLLHLPEMLCFSLPSLIQLLLLLQVSHFSKRVTSKPPYPVQVISLSVFLQLYLTFIHPIKELTICFVINSFTGLKASWGHSSFLSCSLLNTQCLAECLAFNGYSIDMVWMKMKQVVHGLYK